jgi:hypothetical protein
MVLRWTLGRDLWGHSLLQNLRRRADRIKIAEYHGGAMSRNLLNA